MKKNKTKDFFDRLDEVEKDESNYYLLPKRILPHTFFYFLRQLSGVVQKSSFVKEIENSDEVIKWLIERGYLEVADELGKGEIYILSELLKEDTEGYFFKIKERFPDSSEKILKIFKEAVSKSSVSDSDLNNDINIALRSIKILEISQLKRIKEFRSSLFPDKNDPKKKVKITPNIDLYLTDEVRKLHRILSKEPIKIRVDFYNKRSLKTKATEAILCSDKSAFDKISPFKKKYSSFSLSANISHFDQTFDCLMREILGVIIFNYLADLLNKKPERPRKCLICKKWFLANRANHICCSKQCNDNFYAQTPQGRRAIAKASKNYRKNKILRHSKKKRE